MREKKILQIIPADGWQYVYESTDGSEIVEPLVCWALFEMDNGERVIEGMTDMPMGPITSVEETYGFIGYRHSSEHHG